MSTVAEAWTDERVELLKSLFAAGRSASQIAAEIGGGVTRNAVIGKVHRLGLPRNKARVAISVNCKKKPAAKRSNPFLGHFKAAHPDRRDPDQDEPVAEVVFPIEAVDPSCSLTELDSSNCHWPIGDPLSPDFHFCGAPAAPKRPYCAAHSGVAFQPLPARKPVPLSDAERLRRSNHARALANARAEKGARR